MGVVRAEEVSELIVSNIPIVIRNRGQQGTDLYHRIRRYRHYRRSDLGNLSL